MRVSIIAFSLFSKYVCFILTELCTAIFLIAAAGMAEWLSFLIAIPISFAVYFSQRFRSLLTFLICLMSSLLYPRLRGWDLWRGLALLSTIIAGVIFLAFLFYLYYTKQDKAEYNKQNEGTSTMTFQEFQFQKLYNNPSLKPDYLGEKIVLYVLLYISIMPCTMEACGGGKDIWETFPPDRNSLLLALLIPILYFTLYAFLFILDNFSVAFSLLNLWIFCYMLLETNSSPVWAVPIFISTLTSCLCAIRFLSGQMVDIAYAKQMRLLSPEEEWETPAEIVKFIIGRVLTCGLLVAIVLFTITIMTRPGSDTKPIPVLQEDELVEEEYEEELDILVVKQPGTVNAGEEATVKIKGEPNTDYRIAVFYSSGKSSAKGLEKKTSDSSGYVTWTWKVGNRTTPGIYDVVISRGRLEYVTTIKVK